MKVRTGSAYQSDRIADLAAQVRDVVEHGEGCAAAITSLSAIERLDLDLDRSVGLTD